MKCARLKMKHCKQLAIKSSYAGKQQKADTLALKQDIAARQYEMKSDLFDAKSTYSAVDRSKDAKIKPISTMCRNRSLRNGRTRFSETSF